MTTINPIAASNAVNSVYNTPSHDDKNGDVFALDQLSDIGKEVVGDLNTLAKNPTDAKALADLKECQQSIATWVGFAKSSAPFDKDPNFDYVLAAASDAEHFIGLVIDPNLSGARQANIKFALDNIQTGFNPTIQKAIHDINPSK